MKKLSTVLGELGDELKRAGIEIEGFNDTEESEDQVKEMPMTKVMKALTGLMEIVETEKAKRAAKEQIFDDLQVHAEELVESFGNNKIPCVVIAQLGNRIQLIGGNDEGKDNIVKRVVDFVKEDQRDSDMTERTTTVKQ